ncbi:MAG TPA: hypothetical protein VK445_09925, partial [Dissulfurispiraceae bacterium]|nr:hypothetical protein [Dissulfurispiraceae bacterium]
RVWKGCVSTMMRIIIIGCLCIVLAGAASAEQTRYEIPLDDSPFIGPASASVTIVEFIDYQ